MRIYQPMLYVGIGGTGCRIGAELERRLRDEWCGPTGNDLTEIMPAEGLSSFELPQCTQFLYVDLSEEELRDTGPANVELGVWAKTASKLTFQLSIEGYKMAADKLRGSLGEMVDWLPGPQGEPEVSPFSRGAGQIPMAGRAALFLAIERNGFDPFVGPVKWAVGKITNSGAHLERLAGGTPRRGYLDVFLGFSVAGGTGCGMFYDIMHLVSSELEKANLSYNLFPLVFLPSAFQNTKGLDIARARLNGGPAIVDLGRFIDFQNTAAGDDTVVTYPGPTTIRIPPSRAQTAMLFRGATGVESEDLHRSVASLVLSLIGTNIETDSDRADVGMASNTAQSFADEFINRGHERSADSRTGVGRRGVTTAVSASLTIPREQIASLLAGELLGQGVQLYAKGAPGETNADLIKSFVAAAGLGPVARQEALQPAPHLDESTNGAPALTQTLADRGDGMQQNLKAMRIRLEQDCSRMAQFQWIGASTSLLGSGADPFRLLRVVEGNPAATNPADRAGVVGLLLHRSQAPPDGFTGQPPVIPILKNRLLRPVTVASPGVRKALKEQDIWYAARVKTTWALAWSAASPQWSDTRGKCLSSLRRFREQFSSFAGQSKTAFTDGCNALYAQRIGSSYFLPPPGASNDLTPFYQEILQRLRRAVGLRGDAGEAEIVSAILGPTGWAEAFRVFLDRSAEKASLHHVLAQLTTAIKDAMGRGGDGVADPAALPNLAELLQARHAASIGMPHTVRPELLQQFSSALASLKPMRFEPEGTTQSLRTLVSYPGNLTPVDAESALGDALDLGNPRFVQYRPAASDALVVTMMKLEMGVMDVAEPRELLRFWQGRESRPVKGDHLPWRRRLVDKGWLLTTADARCEIVFRLLNVLWE